MKVFKIIRNILIIAVIFLGAFYIFFIRNNNIGNSKSATLFSKLYKSVSDPNAENIVTMEITYKNNEMDFTFLHVTNNKEKEECSSIIHNKYDDIKKQPDLDNVRNCTVITKDGVTGYNIIPNLKRYNVLYTNNEGNDSYCTWITEILDTIRNCKYYTKGYEFVNGKLLYYEYFKEAKLKMFFDNDELMYIKSSDLDESFGNDIKNALYSVKIIYDDSLYNNLIKIPEDYKGYKSVYNDETETQEYVEIN